MSTSKIVFSLNETEKIVIELHDAINRIHCCSDASIFFVQGVQQYLLEKWMLSFNIPILSSLLSQALKNKLPMHKLIMEDLGYLYAQYRFYSADRIMLGKLGFVFEKVDGQYSWMGEKYLLWAYDMAAWLYNDTDGNIVLELAPVYKGNRFDEEGETDFTDYDAFLKNYKPLFTRVIPRDVAQQWLDQANKILQHIADNVERFAKEAESK